MFFCRMGSMKVFVVNSMSASFLKSYQLSNKEMKMEKRKQIKHIQLDIIQIFKSQSNKIVLNCKGRLHCKRKASYFKDDLFGVDFRNV